MTYESIDITIEMSSMISWPSMFFYLVNYFCDFKRGLQLSLNYLQSSDMDCVYYYDLYSNLSDFFLLVLFSFPEAAFLWLLHCFH